MEKYNVENHLFYDGYDLDNELLRNPDFVDALLDRINESVFNNKGIMKLIPYMNGKIKRDGGVSGMILGSNFHFTCHTFCFKNTVFVDYFGDDNLKDTIEKIIHETFKTTNYDMGSKDIHGNFGKHLIFETNGMSLEDTIKIVKDILYNINMTPISELIINEKDESHFDVIQLIAESHISFHRNGDKMKVDVFSCKYFDVEKLLKMFNSPQEYIEVNRGIKYVI